MPVGFTRPFAERLHGLSHLRVAEAKHADRVQPGMALIAPAGHHTRLTAQLDIRLGEGAMDDRHVPSVDVLMRSAQRARPGRVFAILLTGMGDDGADAMVEIKRGGGLCVAEAEESCVVWGMPRAAYERGGAHHLLPLREISYLFAVPPETTEEAARPRGD